MGPKLGWSWDILDVGYQKQQKQQIILIQRVQRMSYQAQTINQFIPNYVVKSDYLPTRVVDGNTAQTSQLLRQYEEEKRRGRVFTQRPAQFNPTRYASYKVNETVRVNQPIDEQNFSRLVRR